MKGLFAPRARSTRRSQLLALAALGVVAAVGGCRSKARQGTSERRTETIESVGKELGVELPAGAHILGVHRERGIDDLIAVKLEMPAADWPGFLARTSIDPDLFLPGERGLLGPDEGFWDPLQATDLRTAQAPLPGARALNVGYDPSRGGVYVVYIVNHGT